MRVRYLWHVNIDLYNIIFVGNKCGRQMCRSQHSLHNYIILSHILKRIEAFILKRIEEEYIKSVRFGFASVSTQLLILKDIYMET